MSISLQFKLTQAGQSAAFNATNTGLSLDLTHVQVGSGNKTPTGLETALVTPVASVGIAAGFSVSPSQIRMTAVFSGADSFAVREVGLWSGVPGAAGSVLVCYWSQPSGDLVVKASGVDFVFSHDMVIDSAVASGSLVVVADPAQAAVLAMVAAHEQSPDPHPQYATDAEMASRAPLASPSFTGNPTAPTPAQFDNDTSIPTTAFVQRALGNARGLVGFSANASLTVAHAGMITCVVGSLSNTTLTLPAVNPLFPGLQYRIFNLSNYNVTVACTGVDTIFANAGLALSAALLRPGDSIVLTPLGDNNRWVSCGGTALLSATGAFAASLSTNGWQRLPSGLIIQWGVVGTGAIGSAGFDGVVTFPVAFPNWVLGVYPSGNRPSDSGANLASALAATATFFTWKSYAGSAQTAADRIFWHAIGY